jgi:hypothetical protein
VDAELESLLKKGQQCAETGSGRGSGKVSFWLAPVWLTGRANAAVDASEAAQIMAIDKTFTDLHAQPVEEIQHPDSKKRALKVVEVGASPAL